MPGMFRKAWNKVMRDGVEKQQRQEMKQDRKATEERQKLEVSLTKEYKPRVWSRAKTEHDFLCIARAEAKRQRRQFRRLTEMEKGGWGGAAFPLFGPHVSQHRQGGGNTGPSGPNQPGTKEGQE